MQLVVGNHVRVVAVAVSRNIDRENNLSQRAPYLTLSERVKHCLIEFLVGGWGCWAGRITSGAFSKLFVPLSNDAANPTINKQIVCGVGRKPICGKTSGANSIIRIK
jgi:hypothetical protein